MARKAIVSAIAVAALLHAGGAGAQVPVIDTATLTQATQTAANTAQIMQTNQQIMNYTQKTLAAVTGNRSTGSLSSIGLSGGFSMSSLPGLSQLLGGGGISMAGLGSFGSIASSIINGLNLVKTLTGAEFGVDPDRSRLYGRGEYRRRRDGRRRRRANGGLVAFHGVPKRGRSDWLGARRQGLDRPELAIGHAKRTNDQ